MRLVTNHRLKCQIERINGVYMLKKIVFILLATISLNAAEYKQGEIVVKFNKGVQKSDYESVLDQLLPFLENTEINSYFNPTLIEKYREVYKSKKRIQLLDDSNPANELARIVKVKFQEPYDALVLSKKLQKSGLIEFAEPKYINEIVETPNDPMISTQYHLDLIQAYDAWDELNDSEILISIVDTGVQIDHEDLSDNIYINPGEDGTDENGNDKRTNGIDDDDNGYVDDFQGWDFSSDQFGEDNDPSPGNRHGTHVAGISAAVTNNGIGVAGVNPNAKILAVKCGPDLPFINSIDSGYEGILYSGVIGAEIINCSWGGQGRSEIGHETVKAVTELGALVVCATGNDASELIIYPAWFPECLSVSSTTPADRRSSFSNYHKDVDVSAPGSSINATVPGDDYASLNGTSMASPVVAGVAAMVKANNPNYTPQQLIAHIKATTDNIEANLGSQKGKMGKGRVNAYKALTDPNPKNIEIMDVNFTDVDGDNAFLPGDEIICSFTVKNMLNDITSLALTADKTSITGPDLSNIVEMIGDLASLEEKRVSINFVLPDNINFDYSIEFELLFADADDYSTSEILSFIVNQSYRDIRTDLLLSSINSRGHIGFNDFPDNLEGSGFQYKNTGNVLFEGAYMATTNGKISDVARTETGQQSSHFNFEKLVSRSLVKDQEILTSTFADDGRLGRVGVEVDQSIIKSTNPDLQGALFVKNKAKNNSSDVFEEFYSGYYFDWDIGPSGQNNECWFDEENDLGIIRRTDNEAFPFIGAGIITGEGFKVFALDNDGESSSNPGVYDGFTDQEKMDILSGKVLRTQSNNTDASMIISTGPYNIEVNDSAEVVYVLLAAETEAELISTYEKAKQFYLTNPNLSVEDEISFNYYPNPTKDYIMVEIVDQSFDKLDIIDNLGNVIQKNNIGLGTNRVDLSGLPNGNYFLRIGDKVEKIVKN